VKPSNDRTKSAAVRLRLEPELKEQATRVLAESGLELSIAIRLFLRQVVAQDGLPFELRPNAAAAQRKRRKASPKKRLHKSGR
jgi:DNA-damage-inducible protein J